MGFLFVSFVEFCVSGAAGSFSEQVLQHQQHGSQRPCTWQRALQPLSVLQFFAVNLRGFVVCFRDFLLFAVLLILLVTGSVSPSTFFVGIAFFTMFEMSSVTHLDIFSGVGAGYSFSFVGQLVLVAREDIVAHFVVSPGLPAKRGYVSCNP